ncbi:MAG: hypothetical protein ACRCZ9_06225 [Fusobacteriaceae bacterium]
MIEIPFTNSKYFLVERNNRYVVYSKVKNIYLCDCHGSKQSKEYQFKFQDVMQRMSIEKIKELCGVKKIKKSEV